MNGRSVIKKLAAEDAHLHVEILQVSAEELVLRRLQNSRKQEEAKTKFSSQNYVLHDFMC